MSAKKVIYATFIQRFLAFTIDIGFILFVFHLPLWLLSTIFRDQLASAVLSMMTVTLTSAYFVYFTSVNGQTFGKKLLKIKVVDIKTGNPPRLYIALIREVVGRVISTLFLLLGYLASVPDYKTRTWHDRLAGTVVIKQS